MSLDRKRGEEMHTIHALLLWESTTTVYSVFPGKIEEILNLMIPELHNPDFNTILVL